MARLKLLDARKQPKPSRAQTLSRLEAVALEIGPAADAPEALDDAFSALERLGPDAPPERIAAAQAHLRALLAEGL